MLAENRMENDRLGQNIAPALTAAEINKLLHEQPPYSWMSNIVVLLKDLSDVSPNSLWTTDRGALTVGHILHAELRCRRQEQL